ncbi:cyclic nucleotide-binding domain-containing protein [Actinomadura soli]|nr:cyclic nucleotide-binding domain-containing protein [Actinomadura soli]
MTSTGATAGRCDDLPYERGFWARLSEAEREAITAAAEERSADRGAVLCHEGDKAADVLVIGTGWVKVTAVVDGRERIITVRGPGDIVGERGALTRRSRSATVVALGDLTGLVVPGARFQELVDTHPRLRAVLKRQERERAEEERRLLFGDMKDVEHRLALLLRELARRGGGERAPAGTALTLPMSRREMARWAGAESAEVDRVLTDWGRRGMIMTARRNLTVLDVRSLDGLCRTRPERPDWSSLTCSVLFVDVAGFSRPQRDEADRQVVRDTLYEMLRCAFEESSVSWDGCYHEDRGDGVLVVVPPAVPTEAVADPTLPRLAAELRRHNRRSSAAVRIQLRVALHVGPVTRDREGLNGDAINLAARMLDAPVLREALHTSEADMALMTSHHVYETVLKNDRGLINPRSFSRVRINVKEAQTEAWMQLFGQTVEPVAPNTSSGKDPERSNGIHFHETVNIAGDLILGSKHASSH